MTERLYYTDSHLAEFEARVLGCAEDKKGWAVRLDATAFFPEGGGQPADTGYIGSVGVLDVQEADGEVLHYCEAPLTVGESYHCAIDWQQRLCRMQNHSGEHIVSGTAHRLYDCENVGFHMGEVITIDFDRELDWQQLMEIERLANEAVWQNLEIDCAFPEEAALRELKYRSKLELRENVRIVTIPGVDCCACCAPHVKMTGEIGQIKILGFERHRGGIRLEMVCGALALENSRVMQENVTAVSQALSAKRHELSPAVERILAEQLRSKERIARLSLELVKLRAEAAPETEGNICIFDEVLDEVGQRELVNRLMEKCGGVAAVFCRKAEGGWRYIMGSRSLDMGRLARSINPLIEGRGGGRGSMIQGSSMANEESIRSAMEQIFE